MFLISCRRKCQNTLQLNTVQKIKGTDFNAFISMSETSEMVFAAFTQHCMQSTDFMSEMSKILCTLYFK